MANFFAWATLIPWLVAPLVALPLSLGRSAIAQVTPDGTLPTIVNSSNGLDYRITGGSQAGTNLFHSFSQFSIPTGGSGIFDNALTIQTIISRVTGGLPSNIDGLLQANGTTSLFLLNPSGITFGPNATLNLGGSFFASTANAATFSDGSQFSAVNLQVFPLLTVSVPLGPQLNTLPAGSPISNQGNLAVGTGQTLTLYGNTVINTGTLTAPGGTVQLLGNHVGLFQQAVVDVSSPTSGGTVLIGGDFQGNGTVPNASRTYVSANAVIKADATEIGNGGKVVVWADGATRFYGTISARGGSQSGDGGFVEISGQEVLAYNGQVNTLAPHGDGGTLLFDPTNIEVVAFGGNTANVLEVDAFADPDLGIGGTQLDAAAIELAGASVILQATNDITFNADIYLFFPGVGLTAEAGHNITVNNYIQASGTGDIQFLAGNTLALNGSGAYIWSYGGNVNLQAGRTIALSDGAQIDTAPYVGNSGNLNVMAPSVILTNGALFSTSTYDTGNAGSLTIHASDQVRLDRSYIVSDLVAAGNSSNIEITTGLLSLSNRARLTSSTYSLGDASSITINADHVQLANSRIFSDSYAAGQGGNILITTGTANLSNGSVINTNAYSTGAAGSITLTARDQVSFNQASASSRVNPGAEGHGGSIAITTGSLNLVNRASLNASTFGFGDTGSITLTARDQVFFNDAFVASIVNPGAEGQGGNIAITTGAFSAANGTVLTTNTYGKGSAGNITINAREQVAVDGFSSNGLPSVISSIVSLGAEGNGGTIQITANSVNLSNQASLNASTYGRGDAGNITINADSQVTLNGSDALSNVLSGAEGNGGTIHITTASLVMSNDAFLDTGTYGKGDAGSIVIMAYDQAILNSAFVRSTVASAGIQEGGSIQITTNFLHLANQALLTTSIFTRGDAGHITLNANQVTLDDSFVDSSVLTGAEGTGGGITINTGSLAVNNVSLLNASTGGRGNAGTITINATGQVLFDGGAAGSNVLPGAEGQGGSIMITANSLKFTNVGQVNTSTFGQGDAGDIILHLTELLTMSTGSILAGTVQDATGRGGSIFIDPLVVTLQDGAAISVTSLGSGQGGDITLQAGRLTLENGSEISSDTASNQGGNIQLIVQDRMIMRFGSHISTNAGTADAGGNGGNITIKAPFVIAVPQENSDITANAFQGQGGNINITTQAIFGLAFRERLTPFSDITASSEFGLQGNVMINTLAVDPSQGIVELPGELTDASRKITQGCRTASQGGRFIVTGRGGLPTNPEETLGDEVLWDDWRDSPTPELNQQTALPVPAQGWVQDSQGNYRLVATMPVPVACY